MTPPRPERLIVRRDGRDALVFRDDGRGWYEVGGSQVLHLSAYRDSHDQNVALFTFMLLGARLPDFGQGLLLTNSTWEAELDAVVECALGDNIDQLEQPLTEGSLPQTVTRPPDFVLELHQRSRAIDDEVLVYISSKTYWAHRLNRGFAVFSRIDALRLGVKVQDLRRLAEAYEESDGALRENATATGSC